MMMVRLFPQGLGADSLFEDPDFPADRYYVLLRLSEEREGAINGKRGTKVSQLDTPEDMSCPMT